MTECNMPMSTLSNWLDRDDGQPLGRAEKGLAQHIDSCPECSRKIASLTRLHTLALTSLEENISEQKQDSSWIDSLLNNLAFEAKAGRSIPLASPQEGIRLTQTEGAVVAAARAVADQLEGVIIGRCRLEGEVQNWGAPIRVSLTVSTVEGLPIPSLIHKLRESLAKEFARISELNITAIDITVQDLLGRHQEV